MSAALVDSSAVMITHASLLTAWFAVAVATFPFLFTATAPYGKFVRAGWGPFVDGNVGWAAQEVVSPVFFWLGYTRGDAIFDDLTRAPDGGWYARALPWVWYAHYFHRALIYPATRRMSRTTAATVCAAVGFNVINGALIGAELAHGTAKPNDAQIVAGAVVTAFGAVLNIWHDVLLARLRARSSRRVRRPDRRPIQSRRLSALPRRGDRMDRFRHPHRSREIHRGVRVLDLRQPLSSRRRHEGVLSPSLRRARVPRPHPRHDPFHRLAPLPRSLSPSLAGARSQISPFPRVVSLRCTLLSASPRRDQNPRRAENPENDADTRHSTPRDVRRRARPPTPRSAAVMRAMSRVVAPAPRARARAARAAMRTSTARGGGDAIARATRTTATDARRRARRRERTARRRWKEVALKRSTSTRDDADAGVERGDDG